MQQKLVDLPVMKRCSKCGVEKLRLRSTFIGVMTPKNFRHNVNHVCGTY